MTNVAIADRGELGAAFDQGGVEAVHGRRRNRSDRRPPCDNREHAGDKSQQDAKRQRKSQWPHRLPAEPKMPPSQVVSTAQEYRSSTVAGSVTARRVLEWDCRTPLLELTVRI
jgi:hypothetical protein